MKLFKLTDSIGYTWNNTQWGENVTHQATGQGTGLCSDGYIHAYSDPLLAVLLNPIHANFKNPQLWEAAGDVALNDGLKIGCKSLTTVKQLPLPVVSLEQMVRFAILCGKVVCDNQNWNSWADDWLSGKDRTARAAEAAWATAAAAAWAAWAAVAWAARAAAWAAARAAASAAGAEWTAERAAEWAAKAAAWAAEWAAETVLPIDLVPLAHKAVEE